MYPNSNFLAQDLLNLLSSPNPSLKSILGCQSVTKFARQKNEKLMNFLLGHVDEMLKMVFSEDKSIEASRAYSLLSLGDISISRACLSDDKFRNYALESLVGQDVPSYILGRLSSLTLSLLQTIPDEAVENCGFIYHLLKHCNNPSVFNFFTTIVSDDEKYEKTQKWLKDFGFCEYILRELQSMDFAYEAKTNNPYLDPVYDLAHCLYQLIAKCAANKILEKDFKSTNVVQVLSKEIKDAPVYVRNSQWAAITACVCSDNVVECLKLVPEALQLITEPFEHLKSFRVSALEFLTQMMTLAPLAYELLLNSSILQSMCTVLVQFPNSSILQGAFRKFVEVGLKNDIFAVKMVGVYTPLFIDQATGRNNRVLSATLFEVIKMFQNASTFRPSIKNVLKEVPEYNAFIKQEYQPYMNIIDNPYGGSPLNSVINVFKSLFD